MTVDIFLDFTTESARGLGSSFVCQNARGNLALFLQRHMWKFMLTAVFYGFVIAALPRELATAMFTMQCLT